MGRVYQTILSRRSIRRFQQKKILRNTLKKMVLAASLAPSAANLQPLEYIVIDDIKTCCELFKFLKWASYLGDKGAPLENSRPAAYIAVILNKEIASNYSIADAAASVENILLVASEEKIGSCWLGAIDRQGIARLLHIPDKLSVEYIIALGYPDELSVVEDVKDNILYWKDENGIMHVPKRALSDILHFNAYKK